MRPAAGGGFACCLGCCLAGARPLPVVPFPLFGCVHWSGPEASCVLSSSWHVLHMTYGHVLEFSYMPRITRALARNLANRSRYIYMGSPTACLRPHRVPAAPLRTCGCTEYCRHTAYLRPHRVHAATPRTCDPTAYCGHTAYCGPAPNNWASPSRSEPHALSSVFNNWQLLFLPASRLK